MAQSETERHLARARRMIRVYNDEPLTNNERAARFTELFESQMALASFQTSSALAKEWFKRNAQLRAATDQGYRELAQFEQRLVSFAPATHPESRGQARWSSTQGAVFGLFLGFGATEGCVQLLTRTTNASIPTEIHVFGVGFATLAILSAHAQHPENGQYCFALLQRGFQRLLPPSRQNLNLL